MSTIETYSVRVYMHGPFEAGFRMYRPASLEQEL